MNILEPTGMQKQARIAHIAVLALDALSLVFFYFESRRKPVKMRVCKANL
jgi:hypothetical protein